MKEYKARQIKRAFKIYKKHGYDHAYRWKVYCQMKGILPNGRIQIKT